MAGVFAASRRKRHGELVLVQSWSREGEQIPWYKLTTYLCMHGSASTRCSDVRLFDESDLQSKPWSAVFLL